MMRKDNNSRRRYTKSEMDEGRERRKSFRPVEGDTGNKATDIIDLTSGVETKSTGNEISQDIPPSASSLIEQRWE